MIPILYSSTETTFTSNGIGRLAECTSCIVTEERNGQYELEMIYPVSGKYYSQITQGSIISVTHDDSGDRQPFRVYRKSAPMDGLVTFNAHHISYDLNHIILHPMTATSVTDAFDQFSIDTTPANPFTFWTDMTTNADFSVDVPASIRSKLGGSEGSILDVYGGEFKWDNRTVRLYSHRGQATDITIRYGKNLTDIKQEVDTLDNYTGLVPYWYDEETETLVTLPAWYVLATDQTEVNLVAMDFSDQWEEAPTAGELRQKAIGYLDSNKPYVPDENIKISFVQLWQTEEYKDVAILQRVNLCDRVNVYYSALGITVEDVEVIKVVYNVLLDRYDEMELGEAQSSLASTLVKPLEQAIKSATKNLPTRSYIQNEIDHATELITGGMGGNIVFVYDANGKPVELLVMDTEDTATAVHVLRINVNGIGFSSTGINGPYTSAWTLDGQFVADFITAGSLNANLIQSGTLSANLIKGGTLKLGSAGDVNGTLEVYDANNNLIGTWDHNGINAVGDLQIKVGLQETRSIEDGYIFYYSGTTGIVWGHHAAFYTRWRSASTNKVIGQTLWTQGGSVWQEVAMTVNEQYKRIVFANCDVTDLSESTRPTSYTRLIETVGDNVYELGLNENGAGRDTGLYMSSGSSQYVALGQKLGSQTVNTTGGYVSIEADQNGFHVLGGSHYIRVGSSYRQIDGNTIQVTTSSKRYKHDITDQISDELDPHRLYDLKMKQFVYNDDHEPPYANMKGKTIPGFIAEDIAEIYPAAVIESNGEIESWSEAQIVPAMLALIQEQKKTIDSLEARIERIEKALEGRL